jgi:signal transduction histidine kinase
VWTRYRQGSFRYGVAIDGRNVDDPGPIAGRGVAAAGEQNYSNDPDFSHISIAAEARSRIDTHEWVFDRLAPANMLKSMGSRSRLLLKCSMGALLLLTALTGVAGLVINSRIQADETILRTRFFERTRALEQTRGAIYLSETLAREYFADPQGPGAVALLESLRRLQRQSGAALEHSNAISANLQGEVTAYWRVLDLMVGMASRRPRAAIDAYFRTQLTHRRETMTRITSDIGATVDREWKEREADLESMYRRFRQILLFEVVMLVGVGSVLCLVTLRRVSRLEADARALSLRLVQAQEQERRSIARELHDEVGQSLSALLLDLGRAAALEQVAAVRASLEHVNATAERIVEEVRRIALSLRPSMLDDLGLVPALEWQAREVGQRSGLVVEVQAPDEAGQLSEEQRTCIYRVAQESLRNSVRHSNASRIRIGLQTGNGEVKLSVEDNGKGFNSSRMRGLGLLGMEERVTQLGGHFRVFSEAGRGTRIIAELPL